MVCVGIDMQLGLGFCFVGYFMRDRVGVSLQELGFELAKSCN